MTLFTDPVDHELMQSFNMEMYQLYFQKVLIWKLRYRTPTYDDLYGEDINYDIDEIPTFTIPGYVNVSDNGVATLKKAGQEIERTFYLYFSRKLVEDTLLLAGFDKYDDVPTDGDVVRIQDLWWEIITADPSGYHMNDRQFPFDMECPIIPWKRDAIDRERFRRR